MIEQVSNAITFYAFFVASKVGKTGLTVTIDVYRNGTAVVTAGSATEIGGGLYKYQLAAGTVNAEGEYAAIFKSSDATVDAQHIPSMWVIGKAGIEDLDALISSRASQTSNDAIAGYIDTEVASIKTTTDRLETNLTNARIAKLDNADVAVSTRSSHTAADVWAATTRTLSAFGFTVDTNANATETAIKAKTDLIIPSQITISSNVAVTGNRITARRGTTIVITLTGLGSLVGRTALYFSVKNSVGHDDSRAVFKISEAGGLLVLNGAPDAARAAEATLVVNNAAAGDITVTLKATASDELKIKSDLVYDVKVVTSTSVTELVQGVLAVMGDVTRAIS